jgi:hypothetical protein
MQGYDMIFFFDRRDDINSLFTIHEVSNYLPFLYTILIFHFSFFIFQISVFQSNYFNPQFPNPPSSKMFYPVTLLSLSLLSLIHLTPTTSTSTPSESQTQSPLSDDNPSSTRHHWMRTAISSLNSPCPFQAFGSVIVNHSDTSSSPHGSLICASANQIISTGNPTLHGEVAAINECVRVLTEKGRTAEEILRGWEELSIYTNGEPCPMVLLTPFSLYPSFRF